MERISTRQIDELGRIVLPNELRAKYGWEAKDTLSLYCVDSNTIMLQLAEKNPGQKCIFCGATEEAGTVNGKDGKPFKTRSGDVASLDYLLESVKDGFIKAREDNQHMSEEDLDIITNAIIKFADLQNNREKDYIFDIEKFSDVTGKTGPYMLYTYLRINKILKNETISINTFSENIYNTIDRDVRLKLTELQIAIDNAFNDYLPNIIAEYIYELSCLVNSFYQKNRISDNDNEEIKQEWLLVISLTAKILKEMLNLLVIRIPSKM